MRELFREGPARWSRREAMLVIAGVAAVTALALYRQTGVATTDTLWAEDGAFFLHDALDDSFVEAVLRPLGGYAHVAPRLLAEVASWFPLRFSAVVLSGGAALLVAAAGAFVYVASGPYFASRVTRAVIASAPVLLPVASYEVLGAAANLHFPLLFGAFWALVWLPRGWGGRLAAAALLFVTATSDPQAALLAPVAALRLVAVAPVRARWRDHVPTAAYAVGMAVQLAVVLATERGFGERAPVDQLVRLYPLRVVSAIAGGRVVDPAWRALDDALTVAAAAAILGVILVAVRGGRARALAVAAAVLSVAYWVGPLAFRWSERMRPTAEAIGLHGSRYGLVPSLLVLVVAAVAVERATRRWVGAAVLVTLLACVALGFRSDNGRSDGPRWRAGVADASLTCRRDPRLPSVEIPIAPPPGWSAVVPCDRLR